MIELVIAFLMGLALSLLLTPLASNLARYFGFVDRPDGTRKTHAGPVALGGGAAVFVTTLVAILLAFLYVQLTDPPLISPSSVNIFWGLLAASVLIVLLGLFDDIFAMRGLYKLIGQIGVVSVLLYCGVRIESVALFQAPATSDVNKAASSAKLNGDQPTGDPLANDPASAADKQAPTQLSNAPAMLEMPKFTNKGLSLGFLAIPFTMLWLLGAINAINLIDGIDGLASSVGLVLCLTFAALMGYRGETAITIIMLALAGSLFGFLRYNFAPATIFLGDAGSMLIGLLIGTIAIMSSTKSAATVALAVPVAVWAVPILDSAAAILRRKLTGRSLFAADRGHLHHSLLVRGWSVRQAVLFIGMISAATSVITVLGIYLKNEIWGLVAVFVIVAYLIGTETFGHIELALIRDRFRTTGLLFSRGGNNSNFRESRIQLQGARQWDKLWTAMIESAESYQLTKLKLIIHIPSLHEDYFASWSASRDRRSAEDKSWQVCHPLIVHGAVVGNLEIAGVPDSMSTLDHILQVLDFLQPIEEDVEYIMREIEIDHSAVRVGQGLVAGRRIPLERPIEIEVPLADEPLLNREKPAAI